MSVVFVATKPGIVTQSMILFLCVVFVPKPKRTLSTALSQQEIEDWNTIKFDHNPYLADTHNMYSVDWVGTTTT